MSTMKAVILLIIGSLISVRADDVSAAVTGGVLLPGDRYPWIATLYSFRAIPGVMTTASAADLLGANVTDIILDAGTPRRSELRRPLAIVTHPRFDRVTNVHDIALILLDRPSSKVPVSPAFKPTTARELSIIGFGKTSDAAKYLPQRGRFGTVSIRPCNKVFDLESDPKSFYVNKDQYMCAGNMTHNSCIGDGGAPLFSNGLVYGISSASHSYACQDGLPSVFTNVSAHSAWIRRTVALLRSWRDPKVRRTACVLASTSAIRNRIRSCKKPIDKSLFDSVCRVVYTNDNLKHIITRSVASWGLCKCKSAFLQVAAVRMDEIIAECRGSFMCRHPEDFHAMVNSTRRDATALWDKKKCTDVDVDVSLMEIVLDNIERRCFWME
jgi:hypothetical protein